MVIIGAEITTIVFHYNTTVMMQPIVLRWRWTTLRQISPLNVNYNVFVQFSQVCDCLVHELSCFNYSNYKCPTDFLFLIPLQLIRTFSFPSNSFIVRIPVKSISLTYVKSIRRVIIKHKTTVVLLDVTKSHLENWIKEVPNLTNLNLQSYIR